MDDSGNFNMNLDAIQDLAAGGFIGFKSVAELRSDCSCLPKTKGVYLFIRPQVEAAPEFIPVGTGGHFDNRDPNVPLELLESNWVKGGLVVYIGKAGGGGTKATLHSRLRQYLRFGQGKPIGHWGGRFIWQLKDAADLVVCWKPLPNEEPSLVESNLIRQFCKAFGQRPFANLKG
jgi:hypothetical protein